METGDAPDVIDAPVDRPESWPVHASRDVLRGGMPFAVRVDEVSLPGEEATFSRLVIEHPGAVVVLAVDDDERVLVLRQYRHAVGSRMVELPAGLLDAGEDPVDAARRELLEETGVVADEWLHLNHLHNSPGFSSEVIDVFLARRLRQGDRGDFEPEHEESDMTVHWVPVHDLVRAVLDKQVTDGPLVSAVLSYAVMRTGGRGPGR